MKKLEEAIKYMFNNTEYNSEGNIGAVKRIPFTLAMMISYYAHRNQLRVNGEK